MARGLLLDAEKTGRVDLPAVNIDITADVPSIAGCAPMEKNAFSGSEVLPQYRCGWALKIFNPLMNRIINASALTSGSHG